MRLGFSSTVLVLCLVFSWSAEAVNRTARAAIEIIEPARLTKFEELAFDNVTIPKEGNVRVASSQQSKATIVEQDLSSAGDVRIHVSSHGRFLLQSPTNQSVHVDLQVLEPTSQAGFELDSFRAYYDGKAILVPSKAQPTSESGNALMVGATLSVNSKARSGVYYPTYEVALLYE